MTSEVLIMNERGIAVAADSAAFSNGKIFKANKLFELTPNQPIGVMIYGANTISTVPFDIFVGEYRSQLGDRRFDRLSDCAADFMRFIENGGAASLEGNPIITQGYRDAFVFQALDKFLKAYKEEIEVLIDERHRAGTMCDFDSVAREVLDRELSNAEGETDEAEIERTVKWVEGAVRHGNMHPYLVQSGLWAEDEFRNKVLRSFAYNIMSCESVGLDTGIIFMGYGDREYLPSFEEYTVFGISPQGLSSVKARCSTINSEKRSSVSTFAQDDVIQAFLHGANPRILNDMEYRLTVMMGKFMGEVLKVVPEKEKGRIRELGIRFIPSWFQGFYRGLDNEYREPVEQAIGRLSKGEMATLVEALVGSTSIRRHVSNDQETVGGPIDVAVISRDDGFIWVKRKQYFNIEYQFAINGGNGEVCR